MAAAEASLRTHLTQGGGLGGSWRSSLLPALNELGLLGNGGVPGRFEKNLDRAPLRMSRKPAQEDGTKRKRKPVCIQQNRALTGKNSDEVPYPLPFSLSSVGKLDCSSA